MQHEAFAELAFQRVDQLRVALGAQRGDHDRLRFAAGEQRRAVGARQHAGADADRAHLAGGTTVDARLGIQDAPAHDALLDRREQGLHFVGPLAVLTGQMGNPLADLRHRVLARLLVGD